ncbi:MAG: FtsH protease activity modulator HflK [Johnsonella sp.]|nr:FtsH protease activity modulator HflK [Johnsonella sp.]
MDFKFGNMKNPLEQDLEEVGQEGTEKKNKGKKEKKKTNIKIPKGAIFFVLLLMIAFSLFSNAFYTVNESEYAVLTTFGQPSTISTPGMHMKIPFVQEVKLVSRNIKGAAIGFDDATMAPVEKESLMITLDYNFINADFYIEYQVTDPVKSLYHSEDPVLILENLAQSYIRDTVGLYNVDDVLTTGKYEIQSIIKEKLINRMDSEDLGIQVVNVTIQDAEPPTIEVANAFKDVETAKQGKETAINNANKYKNEKIPGANAQVDQILKTAQANKQARINEANGQLARFEALYAEYAKFPLITKKRMFYEAMEDIVPEMKVIIDTGNGTQTMLPLESFMQMPQEEESAEQAQSN